MKKIFIFIFSAVNIIVCDTIIIDFQASPFHRESKEIKDVIYLGIRNNSQIAYKYKFKESNEIYYVNLEEISNILNDDGFNIDYLNISYSDFSKSSIIDGKSSIIGGEIDNNWSDEAKTTFYLTEKISPELALQYQFLFEPIPFVNLGYAYSDNWKKGAKYDLYTLGILILGYASYDEDKSDGFLTIAYLASLGISIYKMIDVYNLAEKYNDKLYNRVFKSPRPYFSMEYDMKNNGAMFAVNIPIK